MPKSHSLKMLFYIVPYYVDLNIKGRSPVSEMMEVTPG